MHSIAASLVAVSRPLTAAFPFVEFVAMAEIYWYYARDEQQMGPVTSAELKRLAGAGELSPDDLVWREGMDEWAPALRVKGLFAPRDVGGHEVETYPQREPESPPRETVAAPREAIAPPRAPGDEASPEVDGTSVTQTIVAPPLAFGSPPVTVLGPTPAPAPIAMASPPPASIAPAPAAPIPVAVDAPGGTSTSGSGIGPGKTAPAKPIRLPAPAADPGPAGGLTPGVRLALFAAQGVLWATCVMVVILGGVLFMSAMLKANGKAEQAASAQVSAALFIGAYALARAGERICLLLERFLTSKH